MSVAQQARKMVENPLASITGVRMAESFLRQIANLMEIDPRRSQGNRIDLENNVNVLAGAYRLACEVCGNFRVSSKEIVPDDQRIRQLAAAIILGQRLAALRTAMKTEQTLAPDDSTSAESAPAVLPFTKERRRSGKAPAQIE